MLQHLQPVDQRRAAPDGRGHVHRLGHFLEICALFEALRRVGGNAVGTLDGVSDGQGDRTEVLDLNGSVSLTLLLSISFCFYLPFRSLL